MTDHDTRASIDKRVDELGRDDPDTAEDIARAYLFAIGYIPSKAAHYLFKLQTDDRELRRRLTGLDIRPDDGVAEVR